jgi:3-hydroxyacyl-CoA dehydrogenase
MCQADKRRPPIPTSVLLFFKGIILPNNFTTRLHKLQDQQPTLIRMTYFASGDLSDRHVAVIGSGTLGRRIALIWASKGGKVKLIDIDADAASKALSWIHNELPERAKAVNGSEGEITLDSDTERAVRDAWMVVECVPEVKNVKVELLGQLNQWCRDDTIIATISSSYKSGDLITHVSERGRARVLNTHYFQPPELPPVELMSCGYTDPAIIDFLVLKLREVGLDPVVAKKESTGLIYNRVWAAMKREVMKVLADGVGTPEDIDKLFRYSFQSKGAPCTLMDNVGLQTVCDIEEHYIEEGPEIPRYPVDYIRKEYVEKGNLGTKTGKGLYNHTAQPQAEKLLAKKEPLRPQLIGAWELVDYSAHKEDDANDKIFPMGPECKGIIMYSPDGYMSAQLQKPGQPQFAVNDLNGGTTQELVEAGRNYLAYTGPFYLDENQDSASPPVLKHHMTNSSFPNWLGNTQRRLMQIIEEGGDRFLTLGPEAASLVEGEMRVAQLRWRRLQDNQASAPPTL